LSVAGHESVTITSEQFARLPETVAEGLRAGKDGTEMGTEKKTNGGKEQFTVEAAHTRAQELFQACIEQHEVTKGERAHLKGQMASLTEFMAEHGVSIISLGKNAGRTRLERAVRESVDAKKAQKAADQLKLEVDAPAVPTLAQLRKMKRDGTITADQYTRMVTQTDAGHKLVTTWPKDE